MPIDNREERQSAISFLLRSFVPGVAPSVIDQAERQSAAYSYPGILAAPPAIIVDGFTGGFSTTTLTAMPGGSLLELIGLVPEGYRVRGLATTIIDAFGTSGGLTALLLGDPVLNDRWGRQPVLTEGAMTNQKDARSSSEPIAGAGGYALQIAVEGGLMDSAGRIHCTLFWERLAQDIP